MSEISDTSSESSGLSSGPSEPPADTLHRSESAPPPVSAPETEEPPTPPETYTKPSDTSHDASHVSSLDSSPERSSRNNSQTPASALRRTSSSLSGESGQGSSRDRKRLRFTPLTSANAQAGPSRPNGLGLENVFYPGSARTHEEGRSDKGVPRDQLDYLMSEPGTPSFSETADQIRRTLSLASLDHLIALSADAQRRDKLIRGVSRAGKELVWRHENEKRLFPRDFERALLLSLKRAMRSFILAFSTRAGFNVLLVLLRNLRRRKIRLAMLRHAIFGAEPFRFGAMIGSFTLLNTLTLHLLRLAPPMSYLRRRVRHGLWSKPTFGPPEREGEEGESRWQAAVAGAVGSLGLLWETTARRRGVAQQMFVRGLQGAYNQYTPKFGIHIPHGELLVFGACCGQIMFAWLLSPETMPKEYNNWILHASRVPQFAVLANRSSARTNTIDTSAIISAIESKNATSTNKEFLVNFLDSIRSGGRPHGFAPCALVHPWCNSCYEANFRRFFDVFRFMLPVYSALHLIPMLVLRRHHFKRDPLQMLLRVTWGITRSCSFLGVYVVIFQGLICIRRYIMEKKLGFVALRQLLKRKEIFWLFGFSTCLSLLVEDKRRRAELAMYVLPRALESAWSSARKRAWVPLVPFGETILGATAMAMVMDAYKHKPEALSGVVRKLLFQLVGPV